MTKTLGGDNPSSQPSGFSGWSVPRESNCSWAREEPYFQSNLRRTAIREVYDEGLSQAERERCFALHQLRSRMIRETRSNERPTPATEAALDVSPISVRYHIRSYREFLDSAGSGHGQYGTNTGNFGVSFGQADRMAPEQPASTSGRRPGKEPVTDDVDMAIGEYSDGDSIFEDSAGKGVDEHRSGGGDEAGVSGRDGMETNDEGMEANDEGIGSDDDDPADIIVAEVLADEAKEQPYFTDDATDVHRKEELPPLETLPRTTKILTTWRELIIKKNHVVHGGDFLGLPAEYKLVVPAEGATIFYCPPGHIAVYAKHFDFGLRFPLHPFVEKIFRAWNVCLAQVTPTTIRTVISFVWLCLFKQWPLTLNLFKRLLWLKKDGETGWMSAYSATKRKTVHPPLSSCKDWQDRFYFVQVPDNFLLRRTFTKPRPRMEQYNQRGLGRRERKAFDYLECDILDVGLSKKQAVNRNWLPNAYYILGSQPLSAVGLCNTHCFGKHTIS